MVPFKNKAEEDDVHWNINRVLTVGSRPYLNAKKKKENDDEKKSIIFSLALRGVLILKKDGKIMPSSCANNIKDVKELNKILLAWRYTRGYYEYDLGTKKLIQILPMET